MDEFSAEETNKTLSLHNPVEKTKFEYAVSLFGQAVQKHVKKIPQELLDLPEEELDEKLTPSMTDRNLRTALWREVERVQIDQNATFKTINVYEGICSGPHFYGKICHDEKRMAYIFHPIQTYDGRAAEIVDFAMVKLKSALEAKLIYPNGFLDAKATKVVLDIVQYFENRTKGRVAHKLNVDTKTQKLTANVDIDIKTSPGDLRELDNRIKNLRMQLSQYEGTQLTHNLPDRIVAEIGQEDANEEIE